MNLFLNVFRPIFPFSIKIDSKRSWRKQHSEKQEKIKFCHIRNDQITFPFYCAPYSEPFPNSNQQEHSQTLSVDYFIIIIVIYQKQNRLTNKIQIYVGICT